MPRIVKNIPIMDLAALLMETPDAPVSVGTVLILEPINGSREEVTARILAGYRNSDVDAPFNYIPVFPRFGLPKWAECDRFDPNYHIRELLLDAPATEEQLLQTVMDLHEPLLARDRPGWIMYIINGLEHNRLALYWKVQHAYIDGASVIMRMQATISTDPDVLEARPIWSAVFPRPEQRRRGPIGVDIDALTKQVTALRDIGGSLSRSLLQASGKLDRDMPLPFSAPQTLFNRPVHAKRRLGVGSVPLARFKSISRDQAVSVNEVVLTIIGHALGRYQQEHGESVEKPLIALCPLATRDPGDTESATKIAAILVALGEPGKTIRQRLAEVHGSSRDAKEDAAQMSNEAMMQYMILIAGASEALQKSPLGEYLPPISNVNVSNVAGAPSRGYIAGAEILRTYPVSTLAGGTAVNITFVSGAGRMDFAVVADFKAIPEPQRIADYILDALDLLEGELGLGATRKTTVQKSGKKVKKAVDTKSKAKVKKVAQSKNTAPVKRKSPSKVKSKTRSKAAKKTPAKVKN